MWSHSCAGYVYQVTLRPGSKQDPRELSVTGHRVLAVGSEHLNPDVVRACLEMGMHARSNGVGGAMQHEAVDEGSLPPPSKSASVYPYRRKLLV